jgi:hypothetical protein
VEDQWFDAAAAVHTGKMLNDELWGLLEQVAQEKLGAIFGPDLQRVGSTCAVTETHGLRSLGCYWACAGRLVIDSSREQPRIRFCWQAGEHSFNVPVTDIRLYAADHVTPCEETVRRLADQLPTLPRVLVSVGLSRPYRKTAGDPPRHWLQINNFHLRENPGWRLGT